MSKEKITKDMKLGEIMEKFPETFPILIGNGLQCAGCHMAVMETLEQGAKAHGIDTDALVKQLNASIRKKKK